MIRSLVTLAALLLLHASLGAEPRRVAFERVGALSKISTLGFLAALTGLASLAILVAVLTRDRRVPALVRHQGRIAELCLQLGEPPLDLCNERFHRR